MSQVEQSLKEDQLSSAEPQASRWPSMVVLKEPLCAHRLKATCRGQGSYVKSLAQQLSCISITNHSKKTCCTLLQSVHSLSWDCRACVSYYWQLSSWRSGNTAQARVSRIVLDRSAVWPGDKGTSNSRRLCHICCKSGQTSSSDSKCTIGRCLVRGAHAWRRNCITKHMLQICNLCLHLLTPLAGP